MQRRPTLLPRNSRPFVHNSPSVTSVSRTCEHSLSSKSNRRAACASVRRNPGISRYSPRTRSRNARSGLGESMRSGRRAVSSPNRSWWSPEDRVHRRPLSNHRAGCDGSVWGVLQSLFQVQVTGAPSRGERDVGFSGKAAFHWPYRQVNRGTTLAWVQTMNNSVASFVSIIVVAAVAVGCGSSLSPTSPSAAGGVTTINRSRASLRNMDPCLCSTRRPDRSDRTGRCVIRAGARRRSSLDES